MRHRWSSLSIQNIIAISYSMVIVVLVATIGIISFSTTNRIVTENTNQYVYQLITQVNHDIEYYLKNVEATLDSLEENDSILSYFYKDDARRTNELKNLLSSYLVSREDIINIFLVKNSGEILVNQGDYHIKETVDLSREPWFIHASESEGIHISNAHIQNLIVDRYKWVVSWSKGIKDPATGENLGVILIDLNFNLIEDMLSNISLGQKGYLFLLDGMGNTIYHPKHELIYSGLRTEDTKLLEAADDGYYSTIVEGTTKNYIVSSSPYSGWKVVGAVYENELNPYESVTQSIYLVMNVLALAIAVFLSIVISRFLLHPIKDLTEGMNRFKEGDLDTRVEVNSENEFKDLALAFNEMTVDIKRLVDENQRKEKAKRKFELKSLQSQINPHFLYNTLDSIVWMAEAGLNKEVVDMTYSLSKLFRISINRGSEFVTVEQELEHIESYLRIQKLRYGDKLDYSIEADKQVMNCRIVKIIVQPIVENAIYHGIKKKHGPGFIDIQAREDGENICFAIHDNGVGMEEETVRKLLKYDPQVSATGGGIGVKNVDQRIKLYYGDSYGVQIQSVVFEGTTVTLTIPKQYSSEVTENEN